ncbi:MAG: hypothetical protein D6830_03690 [Ignavibacteria bacterium]|nr:MAG: hypothetical protein D6830_03690 [Ignavibacteria bacterium]
MNNHSKVFLSYPPERDVLFVFGAGASEPDGVPLQKEILPEILNNPKIANSEIGGEVIEFIKFNFDVDFESGFPKLEAVFGFLDYFIQKNESLNNEFPIERLRQIKEYFIKLIHFVVADKSAKPSRYYHKFWEKVEKYNSNISILTLNYDTLLEQSFDFLFEKFGYIDYSIHLMNYVPGEQLNPFRFWIDPSKPIEVKGDRTPVPIKIIKLHGSLNWKYCNCCNQTLLTPWDMQIELNKGKFLGFTYPDKIQYEYRCPLDDTDFQTLIMPPSYLKELSHPVLQQLFSEAGREIRAAKKIVFVGYSLSDADIHIKALLKKHVIENQQIYVVNRTNPPALKHKYLSLSKNTNFIEMSFEDFVEKENGLVSFL